jgi:iron complex outermembrane receptor protein
MVGFASNALSPPNHVVFMNRTSLSLAILAACGGFCLAPAAQATDATVAPAETVVVHGRPLSPFTHQSAWTALAEPNVAYLLKRVPGANLNFNGSLAGVAQYRGLFGQRVNVLVDGTNFGNACPNNMDAPLHYLPRTQLETLEVIRGIAPVSSGIETLGGTIIANPVRLGFADGEAAEFHGRVEGGGQSVDDGYALNGLFGLANARHRAQLGISREDGDDREFGDGRIRPSVYERDAVDLDYGFRSGAHEFEAGYRRNDTGETGTPALPMDDIYSDANMGRLGYTGSLGDVELGARAWVSDLDHRMSNYDLRRVAAGRERHVDATAETLGANAHAAFAAGGGHLELGTDVLRVGNDSRMFSPVNAAFFADNFNDVRRDAYSVYGEWARPLAGRTELELGLRYTHVAMEAGLVDASMARMAPGGLRTLRDRFNAAERDRDEDLVDWAAVLTHALDEAWRVELGFARKSRAPSYQERYLWSPLEANAGLADGNLYVGDLDLDPEIAHQVELGLTWANARAHVTPRAFYHRVDDYIQGTPATDRTVIAVATGNGDATPLKFSNVDAELYGLDAEWGLQFTERLHLDGVISWVRGERRDIDDDLFRIAPLNTVIDLSWRETRWSATLEGVLYSAQESVSATNGETASDGYGLLNLYGQYTLANGGLTLTAGIENLLDKTYQPHLNGINRAPNPDLALGQRLPGDGINGFVQVGYRW